MARGDRTEVERQLRDYNRNQTAPITLLTDGNEWRFYFSQTSGEFADKCFRSVRIRKDDLSDVEGAFQAFLRKSEIVSGAAKDKAEEYLKSNRKQKTMADCLPEARRQVNNSPYPSLPDSLVDLVAARGLPVTREEAVSFIKEKSKEKAHSPEQLEGATDEDATEAGHKGVRALPVAKPGDLRFTQIIEGRIGPVRGSKWNDLVGAGIRAALAQGKNLEELKSRLQVNLAEGEIGERGYALIPETNVSMQNMDANHAARCLVRLARQCRWQLVLRLRWFQGSRLGEQAILRLEP